MAVVSPARGRNLRAKASDVHVERHAARTPGATITISADLAFEHTANVAAAAYAARPPYVSYRVMAHASAPSINRSGEVDRFIEERTSDDTAVLHDLPRGAVTMAHGFPITPTFDALSYFTLSWTSSPHHTVESFVHDVTPLTYAPRTASTADVVVITLRSYRANYADDNDPGSHGITHIQLSPYDFVKAENNADKTFYFSDVYVDNVTGLPTKVVFQGSDDKIFAIDYRTVDGHWLVDHAHYEETLHGPLRLGRLHVVADATFDQFAFPASAPDPRLTPLPGHPIAPPPAVPQAAATATPQGSLSAPAP